MASTLGTLKADARTKNLVRRLKPGDIAAIHHVDLDSTAARSLAEARVGAVLNAAPCISGRYPNAGPRLLLDAGIPVIDSLGDEFFAAALLNEGGQVLVLADSARIGSGPTISGARMTRDSLELQLAAAKANLGAELDAFARNTLQYMAEEKQLLMEPADIPQLRTQMVGKHVLVVVRGEGYKQDLQSISSYLTDVRPILVAVDGAADALLEMGLKPHIIVGDMDSVSDRALRCGAELVVHEYVRDDRTSPALERLQGLGLAATVFRTAGTSEDIAMLLADEKGASLIVAVGTHFSLIEFLDKGRSGMASTFLVRLRIGSKLVDAKGISRLWTQKSRPATIELLALVAAALFPVIVIAAYSPWLRTVVSTLRLGFRLHGH